MFGSTDESMAVSLLLQFRVCMIWHSRGFDQPNLKTVLMKHVQFTVDMCYEFLQTSVRISLHTQEFM